jgi:hypothetical protein
MNWEAIGAVGEILGATVAFITLVYLAMQVRPARHTAIDTHSPLPGESCARLMADSPHDARSVSTMS